MHVKSNDRWRVLVATDDVIGNRQGFVHLGDLYGAAGIPCHAEDVVCQDIHAPEQQPDVRADQLLEGSVSRGQPSSSE
jgi:hypothetical protein